MKELKEKGYITQYTPEEVRKKIIIHRKTLDGFELINQKRLLEGVKCPVLIIHGNNDEEENLLWEKSKAGIELLSTNSKLMLIDGADHSFLDHLDRVIKLAVDWFMRYL